MHRGLHQDIIKNITANTSWSDVDNETRQFLGNSQKEYENAVLNYSLENGVRYKESIVSEIEKDEKVYYEKMVVHFNYGMMLFPYHLSEIFIRGFKLTPFMYYKNMLRDIMKQQKSYDSIPNFTALDILRLLKIGRNQYIDLMNESRSCKFEDPKQHLNNLNKLLPKHPQLTYEMIQNWWLIKVGHVTCQDVDKLLFNDKRILDRLIDQEDLIQIDIQNLLDESIKWDHISSLYSKGLIYFDVPIMATDVFTVLPLKSFVMNRVQGDSIENLLYTIFAALDPSLTVQGLTGILDLDIEQIKLGISLLTRLGLALRLKHESSPQSKFYVPTEDTTITIDDQLSVDSISLSDFATSDNLHITNNDSNIKVENASSLISRELDRDFSCETQYHRQYKKMALIFDSSLTAFLMMGNLSQGLKTHAITMFETGKLPWESLQEFLLLLEQVDISACLNDDIQIYSNISQALKNTLLFLVTLVCDDVNDMHGLNDESKNPGSTRLTGIDMLKCESFEPLDLKTCSKILNKYEFLIYLAPLNQSICPIYNMDIPIFGPSIPEINTPWLMVFVYYLIERGPTSLMLPRGTRLLTLPNFFKDTIYLQLSTWEHESVITPTKTALLTINNLLTMYPLLIQPHPGPTLNSSDSGISSARKEVKAVELNDNVNNINSKGPNEPFSSINIRDIPLCLTENSLAKLPRNLKLMYCRINTIKYFNQNIGYLNLINTQLTNINTKLLPSPDYKKRVNKLKKIDFPIEKSRLITQTTDHLKNDEENLSDSMESWYPYDIYLGIPLSCLKLNSQILDQIKYLQTLSDINSVKYLEESTLFVETFQLFIKTCQKIPDLDEEDLLFPGKEYGKYKDNSFPNRGLLFTDGNFFYFEP